MNDKVLTVDPGELKDVREKLDNLVVLTARLAAIQESQQDFQKTVFDRLNKQDEKIDRNTGTIHRWGGGLTVVMFVISVFAAKFFE